MGGALCRKCGGLLDPKFYAGTGEEYHIGCVPEDQVAVTFGHPGGMDPFTRQLRDDLVGVIRWIDNNSARSQQEDVGPSEIGNPCDRFLAYRLAQWPVINTMTDPWPAIVGTAIHEWLDRGFRKFQAEAGISRWSMETTVHPDPFIRGHMDLFDHWLSTVIDWKTLGPTKLKLWDKSGPPDTNINQVNLYARGKAEAGAKVEKVCLIGLPRSGWLEDMIIWVDDYRPERAQMALDRLYGIGQQVLDLDILSHPERFNDIAATPDMCTFCPFFQPSNRDSASIADESGCPGR